MSDSLRLHPAAQRELDEATAYYDAKSVGLGAAFINEVEHALRQIRAFPEAAPVASGPVRTTVVPAFPYSVHYSVIDGVVTVLALAHHRRRPFYWRGRQ
jgi:plasmid stabilization system protein ParE